MIALADKVPTTSSQWPKRSTRKWIDTLNVNNARKHKTGHLVRMGRTLPWFRIIRAPRSIGNSGLTAVIRCGRHERPLKGLSFTFP
jgi:hypothetical protein